MSTPPTITVPITLRLSDFTELVTLFGGREAAEDVMAKLVDAFLAHRGWINAYEAGALSRAEVHQRILESIKAILPEG